MLLMKTFNLQLLVKVAASIRTVFNKSTWRVFYGTLLLWFILVCWIFLRTQVSHLHISHKLKIHNHLSYSDVQNSLFINHCIHIFVDIFQVPWETYLAHFLPYSHRMTVVWGASLSSQNLPVLWHLKGPGYCLKLFLQLCKAPKHLLD